jgi:predicted Zn-dependent peptidase
VLTLTLLNPEEDNMNVKSKMNTYYFAELQNRNSFSQAEKISAVSLADAQRIALSSQMFEGTVIEIGDNVNDDGFILNPTCIHENGRWDYVEENG